MSFDLSRISFDPRRDFLGVIMQQGRVQLDADWNEWVAQLGRRLQAGTLDICGRAVVPRETPDGFLVEAAGGRLMIGPGRIYVDGLLAENHGAPPAAWDQRLAELAGAGKTPYTEQPHLPEPPELPDGGGFHLVYLDVWQRDVTHLQQPDLVEKAVGVDATGRLQTVWQAKVLPNVGDLPRDTPWAQIPGWQAATRPSAGRLSTGTGELPAEPDPCLLPPGASYRGLENQLYRVEIHRGGALGTATFKWSRDNGTVATRVAGINPARNRLTVESLGRDEVLGFAGGDWVEITDDWRELRGEPGELRRIRINLGVDPLARTIDLETPLTPGVFPVDGQNQTLPERHTRVRRWDQSGQVRREDGSGFTDLDAATSTGEILVPPSGTRLFLEHGILVDFAVAESGGEFRPGDHWAFAARSADASVEALDQAPPLGIHHHFAPLALVSLPEHEEDWRVLWPPRCEGGSCDCTICVTAEQHNDGSATLQQAIDQIRDDGGTICLAAGTYRLRAPLHLAGAGSLRLRGQGWRTVLVRETPGAVITITGGTGVTLENLSLLGAAAGSTRTAMVTVANTADFNLVRTNILGLASGDATSAAVELSGYVLAGKVEACVLVAEQGLVSATGARAALLSAQLRVVDNILFCSQRGAAFTDLSLHAGACRLEGNLILGCRQAAIIAAGGALPGATFTIRDNTIYVEGTGIRAGVDGLRIADNDIAPWAKTSGDGISLERGLDPRALDDLQIVGNRICGLAGHGLAIRQRVAHGSIKQNTVTAMGGAGLVVEAGGSAAYLSLQDNQFSDLGHNHDDPKAAFAGLRLAAVERADITGNQLTRVARTARSAAAIAGLFAGGVSELRLAGNRLRGIGPAQSAGTIAALQALPSLRHLAVDDNTVDRPDAADEPLALATWQALRLDPGAIDSTYGVTWAARDIAHVAVEGRAFSITSHRIHACEATGAAVSVRGNRFEGRQTRAPLVVIDGAASCLFAENHCRCGGEGDRQGAPLGRLSAGVVNASNNRLLGAQAEDTLHVFNLRKRGVVIGNLSTGMIRIDNTPLPETQWRDLNILGI